MRFRRRTIVCQQWTELVTDYLEHALPRGLVSAIDRHLAGCPHCTEYLAQMQRTIEITGAIPADEQLPDELVALLEQAFDEYHLAQ